MTAALALAAVSSSRAAESDALDEEFLEYLAEFDEKQDDWSWFDLDEDEKPVKPPAKIPPAARDAEKKP